MIKIGTALFEACEELERERGISKEVIISSLCDALVAAYKKHMHVKEAANIEAIFDEQTGEMRVTGWTNDDFGNRVVQGLKSNLSNFSPDVQKKLNEQSPWEQTEASAKAGLVANAIDGMQNNQSDAKLFAKIVKDSLTGDDVKEGITMIISCKHPNPQFEGQTKGRLGNSEVRKLADNVFAEGFERFLIENPQEARIIVDKAISACRARNAAKRAREASRKSDLSLGNFFGKLSDCKSKDPSISEIFIVEGDSAGGSAKKGRDSMTQAILPLRGKILNVEKARLDRALGNEEIRTIITAFGTGIGNDFDLSKLRYDKIIIMTDADVDGSHIRVLLLTLFYRFFKPIVEAGHVYAAQPPLFRIMHGKTRKYVLDEQEKESYLNSLEDNVRSRAEIARMKGLGEMDAEELNETTMDINKRVLRKITVEDCVAADAMFNKLMGEEVEPRRAFIEENARYVQNLDI